jgi:hypothetical protein
MNMSSVKELEIQNAAESKRLMQALFNHLHESGIEVELASETATNYMGMSFEEPVIRIRHKNLDAIKLTGMGGGGCDVPGSIMQFQYEVHLSKEIPEKLIDKIYSETNLVKEGKIMGLLGGKVAKIKWNGRDLAEELNKDSAISEAMLKCTKSWNYIEFHIIAENSQVNILGPRFTDPERIVQLYESEFKNDVECCLFGFQTVEIIARHVKEFVV